MKNYTVTACVTISLHAQVTARSKKRALELAQYLALPPLCHQCSGGGDSEDGEWGLSGELDGEPKDFEATPC
jgi:hypothetical protein